MTPLAADRRKLIADNIDLAARVAQEVSTRILDRDELLSAAHLGLCLAAAEWDGGGNFRGRACVRIRWQISDEIRLAQRRRKFSGECEDLSIPLPPLDLSLIADSRDPYAEVDNRDEADSVRRHFSRLRPRHREAFDLYCQGHTLASIGERLGVSLACATSWVKRAVATLREAAIAS